MKLLTLFFTNLLAFFLVTRVRQVVAVTLVGAVAFTIVAPPAKAQLGIPAIIAAAAQVVATIVNVIGPLLGANQRTISAINRVLNQFRNLWEQVVHPSVDQSGAGAGQFHDRAVPRSPHRSNAG